MNAFPLNDKSLSLRVEKLGRTHEAIVFLFDNGEYPSAVHLTQFFFDEMDAVLSHLKKTNKKGKELHRLLETDFKNWGEDRAFFRNLSSTDWKNQKTLNSIEDQIEQLGRSLEALTKLVNHLYHHKNSITTHLQFHWKSTLAMGGSILLVVILVWALVLSRSKRMGLTGEYFSDPNLSYYTKTRKDNEINFNWGGKGPWPDFKNDSFSIRWTGFLRIPEKGEYHLVTKSDDGVRLWLNNKLLIQDWTDHEETMNIGTLELDEGYHPIRIEYYESRGKASMKLLWRQPYDVLPKIIPSRYLIPHERYLPKK